MLFNLNSQTPTPSFPQALEKKISWFRLVTAVVAVILIAVIILFFIGWAMDKAGKGGSQLTEEQKLEALSKLSSNESVASLSDKEKLSILGKLSDNKNAGTVVLSEEEKLKILGQLAE